MTSGAHYIEIPFGVQTTFIQAVTFEVANCGSTSGAITDGHSSNFGSGTAVTAGSLTPGSSGDLLLHFAFIDTNSSVPAATGVSLFSQPYITWALRHAELLDGTLMQYGVYNSTGAINPQMTVAPSSEFISIAVALRGSNSGGRPSGVTINSIQHVSMWAAAQGGPGYANPSVTQFPATGDALVIAPTGGCDISSISYGGTSLTNRLTYVGPGANETEQYFDLLNYTPNNTNTFSITPDLTCGGNGPDTTWTLVFYDISDGYTYSYDKTATTSGYMTGSCESNCDVSGPSISPATSTGILFTETSEWYNQVAGVSSPWVSDTISDSVLYQSPALDQQNGYGHYYPTSTSSETPTWSYVSTVQVLGRRRYFVQRGLPRNSTSP